jgi:hypothetical protein
MSDFLTKAEFTRIVERNVLERKMSYIDSVLEACTDNKIDPEDVRKFVSMPIKDKMESEAMNLNLIPKGNQLVFE